MTFTSAEQMFEHLATYVLDEAAVVRAVERQFPDFRLNDIRKAAAPTEPWVSSALHDLQTRKSVEAGSKQLWRTIHERHPAIMNALASQVKGVVYP